MSDIQLSEDSESGRQLNADMTHFAEPFIHLEHDGKLLLVDKDGIGPQIPVKGRTSCDSEAGWLLRLPTVSEAKSIGLEWDEKGTTHVTFDGFTHYVIRACPRIDWPEHWAWKDAIISDSAVHPTAREMVYRSIHRLVAKVIIQNGEGKMLMAKVKRGFFVGHWTIPGGYLDHNEHPRNGATREILEELGISITIPDPLGECGATNPSNPANEPCPGCLGEDSWSLVSQNMFDSVGVSFVSITYKITVNSDELVFTLKEDEIAEIAWFTKEEALDHAVSWFDISAIERL
ncbi:MAG: NUDIX hydrolase [Euryarchaeota archaeon]|jgi:ADP-ribose pyrophosphatase YjhB (NUDIX family)|nr:NUDIX hydrolase [Euryarchaeota archaeon]MBT4407890.1 NUDIX hydrolase [Euryarchaeota archaeon]